MKADVTVLVILKNQGWYSEDVYVVEGKDVHEIKDKAVQWVSWIIRKREEKLQKIGNVREDWRTDLLPDHVEMLTVKSVKIRPPMKHPKSTNGVKGFILQTGGFDGEPERLVFRIYSEDKKEFIDYTNYVHDLEVEIIDDMPYKFDEYRGEPVLDYDIPELNGPNVGRKLKVV